jgi:hypothetical protein
MNLITVKAIREYDVTYSARMTDEELQPILDELGYTMEEFRDDKLSAADFGYVVNHIMDDLSFQFDEELEIGDEQFTDYDVETY